MTQSLVATLRLEVIKPVDGDWDRLGTLLRALKAPVHRILNKVITDLEVNDRAGIYSKGNGKGPNGKDLHPRTDSYRLTRDIWARERLEAEERVAKKKPYSGDEAIASLSPSSSPILGVSNQAFSKWKKWKKEAWKGTMSLPSFNAKSPIFVAGDGVKVEASDGNVVLSLRLTTEGWTSIIVKPYHTSGRAAVKKILSSPSCVGDVRLIQETHDGKKKWQAFLSYSFDVSEVATGRTMALHRGVRTFLSAAVASEGGKEAYTTILETGEDIRRHKDVYKIRRRSLGRQGRQLGMGAKGHGVARRYERVTRLEDAEDRWVATKCQEVAAHAIRLGERKGVNRILIEDWTNPAKDGAPELGEHVEFVVRSFPLARLRTAIEWAAKKKGWAVEVVPSDYNSRTCPSCGFVNEATKKDMFRCSECLLERSVDVVYAWNMLLRDGKPSALEDAKKASKRAAGRLREKKE